jgi:hypothetical protein
LIGLDSNGAVPHHPDFAAVAAGPSADTAVVDGAILLSRTVIRLAGLPDPHTFLGGGPDLENNASLIRVATAEAAP